MPYLDYNYTENDTFFSIANSYGITVSELFTINNLPYPHAQKPSDQIGLTGTLKVPGESGLNYVDTDEYLFNSDEQRAAQSLGSRSAGLRGQIGFASQGKCWLNVEGVGLAVFPCYPESYSDSHSVNFSQQHPVGRSEPFQIYVNSGPRVVNVSFKMHREMTHTTDIGDIVGIVQAACYPLSNSETIAPRVTLVIGNNCRITGVIGNVSTDWSDTIIGNQYMSVSLGFSVTECTGSPKVAMEVSGLRGR